MLYKFYWEEDSEGVILDITKNGKDIPLSEVEELLDVYRYGDPDYDIEGWIKYLEEKGYTVKGVEYYKLYF